MSNEIVIPVILCGGSGTRLWPASRESAPKQFLKLNGENTLLYETIDRAIKCTGTAPDHLMTVTLESLKKQTIQELSEYDPDSVGHVLGEPCGRNTAAAVAYAALYAEKQFGPDAILWILPADHTVKNHTVLKGALDAAKEAALKGYLVTFGIEPQKPETGYGYIKAAGAWNQNENILNVERFVEKPSLETAKSYIKSGDYLWNSGMFVFTARTVLEHFKQYAPTILRATQEAVSNASGFKSPCADTYQAIPQEPFDTAIMEKAKKVAVIPCNPGWSDVGSWESVWEQKDKDKDGNVLEGRVASVNNQNCLIRSNSLLIAAVGLKDIVITENGDSVLIADKKNATAMKTMVSALKKAGAREVTDAPLEKRPWGQFRVIEQRDGYKVKEILVHPGQKLSLQMHNRRCETWTVISGTAQVTIDDSIQTLSAHESAFIPIQAKHRLENPGNDDLVVIEVQCGEYLGEDDIVRFDDVYGRQAA